jgi:hypothetical protein
MLPPPPINPEDEDPPRPGPGYVPISLTLPLAVTVDSDFVVTIVFDDAPTANSDVRLYTTSAADADKFEPVMTAQNPWVIPVAAGSEYVSVLIRAIDSASNVTLTAEVAGQGGGAPQSIESGTFDVY